jgi:hypothetical protein
VLVCFGLTAYFYYPETRGYSLEQMAVIFDGEDAEVDSPEKTAVEVARRTSVVAYAGDDKEMKNHVEEKV